MSYKQRILTCVFLGIFVVSLFFVPWRVQDRLTGHPKFSYELSPYWQPVMYDEGGTLRPVLLYVEWGVLGTGYAVLYFWLRRKK